VLPDITPIRPEISLVSILGYALFAFAAGLVLTPWFITFLRRNKLGKQLRVETVDGRDPSIFLKYHEKKFGTPTMGGLLIWGSILLTVLFSRVLSFSGVVDNSLLQRGQVYLPLFMLLSLGILGAIDDYMNILGSDDAKVQKVLHKAKMLFWVTLPVAVPTIIAAARNDRWVEGFEILTTNLGPLSYVLFLFLFVVCIVFLSVCGIVVGTMIDEWRGHTKNKRGLGVMPKILSLLLLSGIAAAWFYFKLDRDAIAIPFYGTVDLGWWYIPLFMFIIVGTANAVNVTDGLDGLAGGLLVIAFGGFGILAYLSGLTVLSAFCAVAAAAVAAFLWHNVPPALFYMGDTGALALGGTLGVIALMIDQVLILPLMGFVFVLEMLSVIIQLTSKKFRGGKKVFRAAPIHHHLEALEWGESKVTMRLWIVGGFAALLGILIGIQGDVEPVGSFSGVPAELMTALR
jgi:phospho-N-acetylmuramoyl-pentapeptide-transferase